MKVLFFLIFTVFSQSAFSQKVLNISTGEYPPYTGKSLNKNGFVLDMVREAFSAAGYKVKFHFLPWGRSLKETAEGVYDASAFFVCSKERMEKFHCSESSVTKDNFLFYYKKSTKAPKWKNLDDFKDVSFGLTLGYFYLKDFDSLTNKNPSVKTEIVKSDLQNFKKLVAGKIDYFPCDKTVGEYLLRNNFTKEEREMITYSTKTVFDQTAHILFPKSQKVSKETMKAFEKGMEIITENGIRDRIVSDSLKGKYD